MKEIKLRTEMFQVYLDFDCDLDMQHFLDYTTLRVMDSIHSKSLYCFYIQLVLGLEQSQVNN